MVMEENTIKITFEKENNMYLCMCEREKERDVWRKYYIVNKEK